MTEEDREELFRTLQYFWTQKGDVERFVGYNEEEFKREFPLWAKALKDLEIAEKAVTAAMEYYEDRL